MIFRINPAQLLFLASYFYLASAKYCLHKDFTGPNFFDDWVYFGAVDNLTLGNATWVDKRTAISEQLTYSNDAGHAIIKVDNTTQGPYPDDYNRNSVRITTKEAFGFGSLYILDVLHLPYGCSVWPAFWAFGEPWPTKGEVDIFEGVNNQAANRVALHTETGCYATNDTSLFSGDLTYSNCSHWAAYNNGCSISDTRSVSYGAPFAENGGGVFATEYVANGIKIWFFPRNEIPSDLVLDNGTDDRNPDPSNWGLPMAFWPANENCDIPKYFGEQNLIFDITLCGSWAGSPNVYPLTCPSTGTCYTNNVLDPASYATAYFEIASLRVYKNDENRVQHLSVNVTS